jgi:hypothetical protein
MEKALMLLLLAICVLNTAVANNTGQNLIVNGDFTQNSCRQPICIYNSRQPNALKGWIPEPNIEIGWGSLYNKNIGRTRVLDLAPHSNSCVKQIVPNLQPGTYQLTYEYAARSGIKPSDCEFEVSFNGVKVKQITPLNDKIRSESVDIDFKSGREGVVKFCSVGQNNIFGAVLKSVRMIRKSGPLQG